MIRSILQGPLRESQRRFEAWYQNAFHALPYRPGIAKFLVDHMKPMPKGGQVYFCRSMNTIKRVEAHPVFVWVYALLSANRDQGLMMHHNVSHADLIAGIQEKASYEPGQMLTLGRYGKKQVAHRKWNFEEGQAYYTVTDPRTQKTSGWLSEVRVNELVNWSEPSATDPHASDVVDREYEDAP